MQTLILFFVPQRIDEVVNDTHLAMGRAAKPQIKRKFAEWYLVKCADGEVRKGTICKVPAYQV
jgi:hypothetical protein